MNGGGVWKWQQAKAPTWVQQKGYRRFFKNTVAQM